MLQSLYLRSSNRAAGFMRRFAQRAEGVAAVEFALIVPLMLAMFLGAVEMSQAITANRRVANIAGAIGDLVARDENTVTDAQVLDIMNAGGFLMAPYPANTIKVSVSSVGSSSTTAATTKTEWLCTFDGSLATAVACTCPYTVAAIPPNLVTTSDYVVVTTVTYDYAPVLFNNSAAGSMNFVKGMNNGTQAATYKMTDTVYTKPRAAKSQLSIGGATPCSLPPF